MTMATYNERLHAQINDLTAKLAKKDKVVEVLARANDELNAECVRLGAMNEPASRETIDFYNRELRRQLEQEWADLRAMRAPPQRARKIGGSYQANGLIVSRFSTSAGKERVVFEFAEPAGMLHIFSMEQIEVLP